MGAQIKGELEDHVSDWSDLLSDTRSVVHELELERSMPIAKLVWDVLAYRRWLRRRAGPVTDIELAEQLAKANVELLGHVLHGTTKQQQLAQIAARYFVRELDGEDDLGSPFGFDDDVEVFNAIVRRIGLLSRRIPLVV